MTDTRFSTHPEDIKRFTTDELIQRFLIPELMVDDEVKMTYSMHDRMVTMGVKPVSKSIALPVFEAYTKASYFLQRRELGVINIGEAGTVTVDGVSFDINNRECLYIELHFSGGP